MPPPARRQRWDSDGLGLLKTPPTSGSEGLDSPLQVPTDPVRVRNTPQRFLLRLNLFPTNSSLWDFWALHSQATISPTSRLKTALPPLNYL